MSMMNRAPAAPGSKVDFNAIPVPSNYVPGLGRGATGFTTRSDIGPARAGPDLAAGGDKKEEDGGDKQEFDAFMGNDAGMFAYGEYDEDDKEADRVWESIDARMDERRKEQREKRLKEEIERMRADNPKITEQFASDKRKLAEVTAEQWEAIPEIGDYTIKKRQRTTYAPAPDSLLAAAANAGAMANSVGGSGAGGMVTPGTASTVNDLTAMGEGRKTVMGIKLDSMADSVTGQTVIDPKGYMTDLQSMAIDSTTDVQDIKKARELMKSVISTNPHHGPGWIAAARVEERAGKLQTARQLIMRGCENCPRSEDVWLEAARLHPPATAKAVLARGVAQIPDSYKLYMAAANLEEDDAAKSRVLRRALERIPNSVRLWKAAVELAEPADARILLSRAVECCPQHVELWLALARLESYDNAKKVLNNARKAVPTDPSIWITAAKLEEAQGNKDMVEKLIDRALKSLQANGVVISREAWLAEAEAAETSTPPMVLTCRAIVKHVIGLGVEEEDRRRTWVGDAEEALARGRVVTARAMYDVLTSTFPSKWELWRAAAALEKSHGSREDMDALLLRGVSYCPKAEVLWLMAAKEKWLAGDVPMARRVLSEAFAANPDSEEILLAAFKLEFENAQPLLARGLLAKARESSASSTPRVWMKSAMVERELGEVEQERALLEEGLKRFPTFHKLWLMLGQLEERQGRVDAARAAYTSGTKRCPDSIPLWRSLAALEEKAGNTGKVRAVLEQARFKNPKQDTLWLAAVRAEQRAGNAKAAEVLLAKGMQDCPKSGILWAEAIAMAPRPARKAKAADAVKACGNQNPAVLVAGARQFAADRKLDAARKWLTRAVTLEKDNGDYWAELYRFELQHGDADTQAAVLAGCVEAEPHYGERWTRVSKDLANAHQPTAVLLPKVVTDLETRPAP